MGLSRLTSERTY